jgi:cytochrome c
MKGSILVMNKNNIVLALFACFAFIAMLSACKDKTSTGYEYARNMYDPIAYNPDQANKNFKNGQTAQTPPANTDPIGFVKYENANTKAGYEASATLVNPLGLTEQTLVTGKHLYTVFCSPCHGAKGDGQGHLVTIGKISGVPAYHGADAASSRDGMPMSSLPAGRIYHAIVYGLNSMGSHASQLSPEERWKVVLYVQQLQKIK